MHICYLINTLAPAGAEKMLLNIVRHSSNENDVSFTVCFMGRDETLLSDFEDAGARVVSFNAEILFPYDPLALCKMFQFFRREPIDILHTHLPSVHWIGRLIGRLAGIDCIVSTHHNLPDNYSTFSRFTERMTRSFDTVTIAVSKGVRNAFTEISDDRWRVIYNGINVDGFNADVNRADPNPIESQYQIGQKDLVFLNVARYSPQKAQIDLVRAMEQVLTAIPDSKLLLVGWGDEIDDIDREISDHGLEKQVFTTGRVPTVHEYYAIADVFVLSSRIEGFGVVLLEAMAAGLPVIATNIPGVDEVVTNGLSGCLVPPGEPDRLAEAMISMQSEKRRKLYGMRGREHAARKFDIENTVDSHLKLYREIFR